VILVTGNREGLLLRLWAEASNHDTLQESLPVFLREILDYVSLAELRVEAVLPDHSELQILAKWTSSAGLDCAHRASGIRADRMPALLRWAGGEAHAMHEPGAALAGPFRYLTDIPHDSAVLLAPLAHRSGLLSVVRFVSHPDEPFSAQHLQVLTDALPPLSAIIENDHRLREIQRLGAAAEADKQVLLLRLGREHMGDTIVGIDSGLRAVMLRASQVATTDASVLLLGETGSGKEVIARAIHERSLRTAGPFVRVNCGALPPDLIDSELFGHEKGSFTGALGNRRGWFERADGGTLFLDEVGELPLAAQVRLLRVLQDGIIQRVGSERDIQVDVRLIAATHRDLPLMVQEGHFREDLWYRLAVFPIIIPPLHERPEDIEPLARHLVQRAAHRLGVPTPPIQRGDIEQLLLYRWPGNVRELGSVLERAVILGHGRALDLDSALGAQHNRRVSGARTAIAEGDAVAHTGSLEPLANVIRAHLGKALAVSRGRIDGPQGAAHLLQLNPSTLRAKLRKYQLEPGDYR
jgi:transcriptional regulator with GAF, ATPase, and Fis domain